MKDASDIRARAKSRRRDRRHKDRDRKDYDKQPKKPYNRIAFKRGAED